MSLNQPASSHDNPAAAELTAAAERMVLLWDRAADGAVPRIPPLQVRVLTVLAEHGPMNLTRLAQAVGVILSSASRLCDRLEAAGLLNRRAGADSRREITVSVSSQGRQRLRALAQAREADFAPILDRMSAAGRTALLQGLREFAAAL